MTTHYSISPIGFVKSAYPQKFGIPRQPGLVPSSVASIELLPEFTLHSVRGLTHFDYVWVQFIFHDAINEGYAELVRAPRLGGKKKVGVFASRSPHRPNHLGLSLLKLESISDTLPVTLQLSGADLLDNTPVIDIKPYLPFVEAKTSAASGFVTGAPKVWPVQWTRNAQVQVVSFGLSEKVVKLINETLAQDPRPAYQHDENRVYVARIHQLDVVFRFQKNFVEVINLINNIYN